MIAAAPAVVTGIMAFAAWLGWWFRGTVAKGKVEGLEDQVKARETQVKTIEERLRLADDKVERAQDEKRQFESAFRILQQQIESGAPKFALSTSSNTAESHMVELSRRLADVRTTLAPSTGRVFAFGHCRRMMTPSDLRLT